MSVEAIVLGTAQDGGVPQAGCTCRHCGPAYRDERRRRWVACLGLADHGSRQSWLIDATPDLREQLHALHELAPDCPLSGILLTHAHVGHYAGLVHLGREAWDQRGLPVYASERMVAFLGAHAPWSQLVALGNVRLVQLTPGQEAELSPGLSVTPAPVPHRDEFSDTLAFVAAGAARRLFYCPDIDAWDGWERDVRQFVAGMDVALVDGTFFSVEELPGRDPGEIPHPLVTDTVRRLVGLDCDVRLIHLNHTNPLQGPGPERAWVAAQGIRVAARGDRWLLSG